MKRLTLLEANKPETVQEAVNELVDFAAEIEQGGGGGGGDGVDIQARARLTEVEDTLANLTVTFMEI